MSGTNGSADGDLRRQIHQSIDLNQQVPFEPEFNSSPSNDLPELQSSLESMLTKVVNSLPVMREGEKNPEMENVVQPSTENEEVAIVDMALHLQPTVLNLESIQSTYHAASPPAPPPPSPISVISMEPPYYLFDLSVSEVDSADGMPCFVVMGCTYCYIYVMVSEADPYCPQCGTDDLLDQFCGNWGICK